MLFMDSNLIMIWAAGTTDQGKVEQWFFLGVFANVSTGMIWEKQVRRTMIIKAGQKYKDKNNGVHFLFGAPWKNNLTAPVTQAFVSQKLTR